MLTTDHVCLTVSNLEKSLAFYKGILGMEVISLMPDRQGTDISRLVSQPNAHLKIAFLKLPHPGNLQMELMEYLSPPVKRVDMQVYTVGAVHLCFTVDDIDAACAELRKRGVQFDSDPVDITGGVNKGRRAVYFHDPDGIGLELCQLAKPS